MKRNRLKITMESRIHGDVYVRFGGERLETYRPKGRQGALRLSCEGGGGLFGVIIIVIIALICLIENRKSKN